MFTVGKSARGVLNLTQRRLIQLKSKCEGVKGPVLNIEWAPTYVQGTIVPGPLQLSNRIGVVHQTLDCGLQCNTPESKIQVLCCRLNQQLQPCML